MCCRPTSPPFPRGRAAGTVGAGLHESGFSLVELLVAMALVLAIMGATLSALTNAFRANEMARAVTGVNNNLRIGTDLLVRDLIQVGQGMPLGRIVQVPNGAGAATIKRPLPPGSACTGEWPAGTVALTAVTPGPGCGPEIDGVASDIITVLEIDASLENVPVQSFNVGAHTALVSTAAQQTEGIDISDVDHPEREITRNDLVMFTKGDVSALAYVTAVDGNQTITFAGGDPMSLNQFVAAYNGTVDDLATLAPTAAGSARVSRMRMITYYIDNTLGDGLPRLMRRINWGDPLVALNQRASSVAFGIERLQISYDLVDSEDNPDPLSNVRMVAADYTTGGACAPIACAPNLIRKVNVEVIGRSPRTLTNTGQPYRNILATQVSLRSLALVDRYR